MQNYDLCLYHRDPDGCAAAAVVLLAQNGEGTFQSVQYGEEPPDVKGKRVIIVDFSYSRDILLKMNEDAESLYVIDHHKSAQESLEDLDFCYFDMKFSGAGLTWNYFHPIDPVPLFLEYIQDRDLWKWELPSSKAVSVGLQLYEMTPQSYLDLMYMKEITELLAIEGEVVLRYQEKQIERILLQEPEMVIIAGYEVPCRNHTDVNILSELCQRMAEGKPFGACYFDVPGGNRVFSLRSCEDGMDVSEIAKKYGGGGHKHAAGFNVPRQRGIIL